MIGTAREKDGDVSLPSAPSTIFAGCEALENRSHLRVATEVKYPIGRAFRFCLIAPDKKDLL